MNTDHTGAYGLGIGYNTLSKLTTGANNVALGSYALNETTTGRWNTATGVSSGAKLTTGNFNAFSEHKRELKQQQETEIRISEMKQETKILPEPITPRLVWEPLIP